MKHGRVITVPYSAAEEGAQTIDSVDALNGVLEAMQDNPDDSTDSTEPETPAAEPETPAGNEGTQTEPEVTKNNATQEQKQQYAFAQQQHEITELTELLKTMADATGIKYDNKKDLVAKLKDKALVDRATQQNIPVELLREVEQLRADSNQWKQYQHEQRAMQGFNKVQADYGLDQSALEAFAVELDAAGRNPFTQDIDVVAEYKARHIDEIVQRRVEEAVQAALKRDAGAQNNSSTPSAMQGSAGTSTPEKMTTVAQLNALLGG